MADLVTDSAIFLRAIASRHRRSVHRAVLSGLSEGKSHDAYASVTVPSGLFFSLVSESLFLRFRSVL